MKDMVLNLQRTQCGRRYTTTIPGLQCWKLTRHQAIEAEDELHVPLITGDTEEEGSPSRVITRREELIFDVYLNEEYP